MRNEEKNFLIVDDEPDICWALEHVLKLNGFFSKYALNGTDAMSLVRHNKFSLAFLDAKLPDIEALDLAAQIREVDPSIPIVIVSGYLYMDNQRVQHALTDGLICDFIAKPFKNEEIIRVLKKLVFCFQDGV